jgi:hypothetical protein
MTQLGAGPGGVPDDRGQVGHGGGGGLIQDDQGVRTEAGRAAGLALAGQVAQELGGVLGYGDSGLDQDVPPGAGRGDPDDLAFPGRAPRFRDAYGGVGLAGPGRPYDQFGAAWAGQREERGRGLVQAQPAVRDAVRHGRVCVELRL